MRRKTTIFLFIVIRKENRLGVDEAGLWSFITLKWLSKFMQLAYRKGLKLEDIPNPSPYDACEYNVQR